MLSVFSFDDVLVFFMCFQMGYLRKETDGSLLYTVVNQLDPDAEGLLSWPHNCLLQPCAQATSATTSL